MFYSGVNIAYCTNAIHGGTDIVKRLLNFYSKHIFFIFSSSNSYSEKKGNCMIFSLFIAFLSQFQNRVNTAGQQFLPVLPIYIQNTKAFYNPHLPCHQSSGRILMVNPFSLHLYCFGTTSWGTQYTDISYTCTEMLHVSTSCLIATKSKTCSLFNHLYPQ